MLNREPMATSEQIALAWTRLISCGGVDGLLDEKGNDLKPSLRALRQAVNSSPLLADADGTVMLEYLELVGKKRFGSNFNCKLAEGVFFFSRSGCERSIAFKT